MKTELFQVYLQAEGKEGGNNGENSAPEKPEEKQFTQAELDKIVSARLHKEKEKYADYDVLKTKASELDSIKQQKTELENQVKLSNDTLVEVLADLMGEIDENKKTLIPEQLTVTDKIKFINKNKVNLVPAPAKPTTPPSEDAPKGNAGLYGGKYKTLGEYASADPVRYLEDRKAGKI